jgi:hypothetical protein
MINGYDLKSSSYNLTEALSLHLPGNTEGNHEKPQSG